MAHCRILQVPNTDVISAKDVQSSGERKNEYVPLSIHSSITPLAQISIAEISRRFIFPIYLDYFTFFVHTELY